MGFPKKVRKRRKTLIKDEMKMRLSKIYEKVDDVHVELIEQQHAIIYLQNIIIDLAAEVDSLEMDLECEDE